MLKKILFLILTSLIVVSCVLPSKYQKAIEERNRLNRENASLQYLKTQSSKDKKMVKELREKVTKTEELMYEVNSKYTAAKNQYEKCNQEYNSLLEKNKKLLNSAFDEKTNMSSEIAKQQKLLADKERRLQKMESDLRNQELKQELLTKDLESRQKNIDSLVNMIALKDNKLSAIKNKIKSVLEGYSNDEVLVEKRKDGRLYISLSQNLLFAKGSDKLDWLGKAALVKVAEALKTESDLIIIVEGHTDTDGSADRNWNLSTKRALAVVKVLQDSGVMPQKLTAAGRGQYVPVALNDNEINKAKNRRTEIILEPNISQIIDFIK